MVGLKEICALLVAGSMGAGSVVAVQQAKAPQARVKAKPAKPKVFRPAPRPVSQAPSIDCPTVSSLGGGLAELGPIVPMEASPTTSLLPQNQLAGGGGGMSLPPGGGGGASPSSFPGAPPVLESAVSGVPQPATWAMMVSGFGLIGLALRRRPESETLGSEPLDSVRGEPEIAEA
jgi:hypothetical protein